MGPSEPYSGDTSGRFGARERGMRVELCGPVDQKESVKSYHGSLRWMERPATYITIIIHWAPEDQLGYTTKIYPSRTGDVEPRWRRGIIFVNMMSEKLTAPCVFQDVCFLSLEDWGTFGSDFPWPTMVQMFDLHLSHGLRGHRLRCPVVSRVSRPETGSRWAALSARCGASRMVLGGVPRRMRMTRRLADRRADEGDEQVMPGHGDVGPSGHGHAEQMEGRWTYLKTRR